MGNTTTLILLTVIAAGLLIGVMVLLSGKPMGFELSKLYFAVGVLTALGFVFVLGMLLYAFGPDAIPPATESPGKAIFDACVRLIPPIVTLVIGFYFGTIIPNNDASRGVQAPPSTSSAVAPK